jgi:hypothetical protein
MATTNVDNKADVTNQPLPPVKKGKWWPTILLGLAAVIGAFVVVVLMQPADFRVSRTATIAAAPEVVFAQVNDFHNWQKWSPWAKLDPAAKNSFEGPESGNGAIFRWEGNSEVGKGSTTITESVPNERVRMKLEFIEPFAGTSDVEFTLKPAGEETELTWNMASKNDFLGKVMGLFMDCEKMCGDQFEQGLANLNELVANSAK